MVRSRSPKLGWMEENALESGMRMEDVARLAGVSRATVSRVLSGSPAVTASTREKVMNAVDELGYVPNLMAQNLANTAHSKDPLVGLLLRDPRRAAYGLLFSEIQTNSHEQGLEVVTVAPTQGIGTVSEQQGLNRLLSVRVKGLFVATGVISSQDLRAFLGKVPIISVGRPEEDDRIYGVSYDEVSTGNLLADAVLAHGHTRIAVLVTSDTVSVPENTRANAIIQRLSERGIRPRAVQAATFGIANEGVGELLNLVRSKEVTAVMFPTDDRAIGFLDLAAKSGVRVPEDVSVTGADGILPGMNVMGLASVRIQTETVAARAVTVMKELIANPDHPVRHEKFPGFFMDGSSLSVPPDAGKVIDG